MRNQIIEHLENNLSKKLSLVIAPTGYGKSVTISEWLDYTKAKHCWISLDDELNDLRLFLTHIIFGIRSIFPDSLPELSKILEAAELPDEKTISIYLINELDKIGEEVILVLDDYHFINNKQIHNILDELLKYFPRKFHLVIITRRDPPLKISSLKSYGDVNEIRMPELGFNQSEILELTHKILGTRVSGQLAEILLQKTEGWIVGLRLALIAFAKQKDIEKALNEIQGDSHYLTRYLLNEVILMQGQDIRELLLAASLPDRFTKELLEVMVKDKMEKSNSTFTSASENLFDQFRKSTSFIIPLDYDEKWFRYHHFFRDFLQKQLLHSNDNSRIKKLYLIASNWFEANNLIEEAILYSVRAGEYSKAAEIIGKNRLGKLYEGKWLEVKKWISLLPENTIQNLPEMLLTQLFIYENEYRVEEIISTIHKLEKMLMSNPESKYLGELLYHKGHLNHYFYWNPEEAIKLYEQSESIFPDKGGTVRLYREAGLAAVRQMVGQKNDALKFIGKKLADPETTDRNKTFLHSSKTLVNLVSGELKQSINAAQDYSMVVKKMGKSASGFWSDYLLANSLFQSYELKSANDIFFKLTEKKNIIDYRIALDILIGYSLSTFMSGEYQESTRALTELHTYSNVIGYPSFTLLAQSCQARINLLRGDNEPAVEWYDSYNVESHTCEFNFFIEVPAITKARIGIAAGDDQMLKDTIDSLTKLLIPLRNFNNIYHQVDILILSAIGFFKLSENNESLKLINEALTLSEKNDFLRPFIEPGEIISELLENISFDNNHKIFVNKILRNLENGPVYDKLITPHTINYNLNQDPAKIASTTQNDSLTVKEIKLLTLLADGFRNKEIADKLELSTDSIKKYLYYIYQKLGVRNRVAAVAKAGKLGLIISSGKTGNTFIRSLLKSKTFTSMILFFFNTLINYFDSILEVFNINS